MTKSKFYNYTISFIYIFYVCWWIFLHVSSLNEGGQFNDYFTDTYGLLAFVGGVIGLAVARRWDFTKSLIGKAIVFLAAGLLSQFLGQLSYTMLFYVYGIENAYPAFGEIFFLATIPFAILGVTNIAKASGFTITANSYKKKAQTVLIPAAMVLVSYLLFLRNYDIAGVPFKFWILDYIYPLGQALFVSLAFLTYITINKILGGIMRKKILFILLALVFQYVADSMFIYETRADIWYPGGYSDLMFLTSYFLMAKGLILFDKVEEEISQV